MEGYAYKQNPYPFYPCLRSPLCAAIPTVENSPLVDDEATFSFTGL
jgi:hypothetical protein